MAKKASSGISPRASTRAQKAILTVVQGRVAQANRYWPMFEELIAVEIPYHLTDYKRQK
jgi:hypothetical protein